MPWLKSWLTWNALPALAPWVQRLAAWLLTLAGNSLPVLDALVEALEHPDPQVQALVRARLRRIDAPIKRDHICQIWSRTRAPHLSQFLREQGWVAEAPIHVRVLTFLFQNKAQELAERIGAASLPALLEACADPDPLIAERARRALLGLKRKKALEALWDLARQSDHPLALEALANQAFEPEDEQERALYWLLQERWEAYDALDFDRRRLRALYTTATEPLRARIRERLRRAGRTDFLPILTGGENRLRAAALTPAETQLVLDIMVKEEQWPALWELVPQVHTAWSAWVMERLLAAGWQPSAAGDQDLLVKLGALVRAGVLAVPDQIRKQQALLQQMALVRAPGRVNAVAFAPQSPLLAAAIGTGRVVLWDYVKAQRTALFTRFQHAVHQVAFTPTEWLLCSERAQRADAPVSVYLKRPEETRALGQHRGRASVAVVGEAWGVSSGREGTLRLWELPSGRLLGEREMHGWAHQLCPVHDQSLVFLGHLITHLTLPNLKEVGWRFANGRVKTATLAQKDLVLGMHQGQVVLLDLESMSSAPKRELTRHPATVVGLAALPRYNLLLSLDSSGLLRGVDLENWAPVLELDVHSGHVTGLQVSADGAFMALGTSETSFALWDLRLLELPYLFARPMAQLNPASAGHLRWLAERPTLDPAIRRALEFTILVLLHRGRYEIELEAAPELVVGEFDIELEG